MGIGKLFSDSNKFEQLALARNFTWEACLMPIPDRWLFIFSCSKCMAAGGNILFDLKQNSKSSIQEFRMYTRHYILFCAKRDCQPSFLPILEWIYMSVRIVLKCHVFSKPETPHESSRLRLMRQASRKKNKAHALYEHYEHDENISSIFPNTSFLSRINPIF
jgi:hypothetical protein